MGEVSSAVDVYRLMMMITVHVGTMLNTSRTAVNRQYLNKPPTSLATHVPGTLAQYFYSIIPNFFVNGERQGRNMAENWGYVPRLCK